MTMNVVYSEIIPANFLYVLTKCHAIFIPRYLINILDRRDNNGVGSARYLTSSFLRFVLSPNKHSIFRGSQLI